ncbi:MAG TPA: family 20 glycosylhydrolase, partial [Vicinamibacterales bacterium]|nr:family 20 glycosylhydrolase [Vicinamibacterales bacterium]
LLAPALGAELDVRSGAPPAGAHVELRQDPALGATLGAEGYALDAGPRGVTIRAATPAGVFYGTETLRQLLPAAIFSSTPVADVAWQVPAVRIEDVPRFSWRGSHLDVSRHFMPLDYVRKHLDLMALHKLNRFHWHLTDDQGWRIEITQYPKLTEIAAWRTETIIGHERTGPDVEFDGRRHGGYYTQDEIRAIVAYAAERFITVVPEIEMPGHSQAIISAYPELGSVEEPVEPRTHWGVSDYILNPEPHTITFMQNVLAEVLELFPGPWIHIGGDEATKTQWQQNPRIQARMRDLGLANEHELQSWFIRQMDTFLTSRGRRLIGWDEILEGGLAPNATVMAWRGVGAAVDSARAGHDAVLTPTSHTYFDYYQADDTTTEPLAIGGFLPFDRVYTWEPMPHGLEPEHHHRILGVQAQLWTEYMKTPRQVEYMAFPRLSALAEVAWTPVGRRDLEDFRARLGPHLERLRHLDVAFRPADLARPLYKDASQPVEARVADLVSRMTRTEKFWQLFMLPGDLDDPNHDYSNGVFGLQIRRRASTARAHAERVNAIQRHFVANTRLGIPIIPFEETLHGVHMPDATSFPQSIALAATFDLDLMRRVSAAIAREARTRGIRQALSPVVNIADDVRWGRVEETYGEDPYLAAEMGRAFVEAFERAGIVATPKHFVANVGEGGRDSYPIQHGERLLAERYYPPFEVAVREAGARSVMSAYNSVDGLPATQNPALLDGVLRRDWGFRGFVISDAAATGGSTVLHHTNANTAEATADAIRAGLDVIFQTSWEQHRAYQQAFSRGLIPDDVIDTAVARVLRVKFELGLFEDPYVDPDEADRANGHPDHRALALEAARRSLVLLRNERATLPFGPAVRRVAVIGRDAVDVRLGGYSGPGIEKISIFDGIRAKAPGARHVPGVGRDLGSTARRLVTIPAEAFETVGAGGPAAGLTGEYFANITLAGEPAFRHVDAGVNTRWTLNSPGRGLPFDWYSVRWRGTLVAPAEGARRLGIEGNDGYRLWIDDRLVIDNWRKQSYGLRTADVSLAPGSRHAVRLEFYESTGNARVRLVWDAGVVDDSDARIAEAVVAARESDVAVVVAGIEEGEFRDRAFLGLPGRQADLIRAVAATGTPTVVVIVGGSAVTMAGWLDEVGAVVQAWYPGEAGGTAVADVVFGDVNPAGRVPITFPMAEGQLPLSYNHKPTGRGDDYVDLTGMPLFPFGHGLSYTTFEYSNLRIAPVEIATGDTLTITCSIRNTGTRAGDEVVQLYVRDVLGSVARPVMELKRFTRVSIAPGESRDVTFELRAADLRMLDATRRWIVEPGAFRVMVGASSEDIRLRGEFAVR